MTAAAHESSSISRARKRMRRKMRKRRKRKNRRNRRRRMSRLRRRMMRRPATIVVLTKSTRAKLAMTGHL